MDLLQKYLIAFIGLASSISLEASDNSNAQINNVKQEFGRVAKEYKGEAEEKCNVKYSLEEYSYFSKIFPILKRSFEFSEKMTTEINAACTGIEDILTAESLANLDKLLESKKMLAAFSGKLDHYRKKYQEEFDRIESEIKTIFSGNEYLQKQALKGFEEGKKQSQQLMYDYFDIEMECIGKVGEILNFAKKKLGTFYASDEGLFFENDDDAETFGTLVENLVECSQKEEAIVQKLEMQQQSVLQKMENLSKK